MTLFLVLVGQLQNSIKTLGSIIPQCYSLIVSAKRIREITELESEEYEVITTMPKVVGLKAKDVNFTYLARQIKRYIHKHIIPNNEKLKELIDCRRGA
jgi:hypothetical protein